MAVPAEYQSAVDYLREHGAAATTDVFSGLTYWDDDQLYAILNNHISYEQRYLVPVDYDCLVYRPGTYPDNWYIRTSEEVRVGSTVATPIYDAVVETFTFTSTPSQSPVWYFTVYNMNEALAELWNAKAAHRYELIRVRGGANTLYMEQEHAHCVERAKYYRARSIRRFKR